MSPIKVSYELIAPIYELIAPIYEVTTDITDKKSINRIEKVMRNRINNTYFTVIGDL